MTGLLAAVLGMLCLPGFRQIDRRIPLDWTLLTYALYAPALFLFAAVDQDQTPGLTFLVRLPSLFGLAGAFFEIHAAHAGSLNAKHGTPRKRSISGCVIFRGKRQSAPPHLLSFLPAPRWNG